MVWGLFFLMIFVSYRSTLLWLPPLPYLTKVVPQSQGEDDIQKTLKDIGVQYTHRNENLIAENDIQRQRIKHIMEEVCRFADQRVT